MENPNAEILNEKMFNAINANYMATERLTVTYSDECTGAYSTSKCKEMKQRYRQTYIGTTIHLQLKQHIRR